MKKIFLSFPYLFVGLLAVAQSPKENSLLWKIEGKGLTKPSYLYGTIHIMCPDDIKITPNLKSAFNCTKQLYLELDMDDPKMMVAMMQGMMMKDNESLQDLLPEKDYDSVSAIFQSKTGMPMTMLARTKPILLMAMMYPSLLGCQPEGWEHAFMKMASSKKMEVKGLEKVEEQIAVLDSIPNKVQAEMFKKIIYNLDSAKHSFDEMVNIYKKQDLQTLYQMTVSDKDFGEYDDIMLKQRNTNWINGMSAAMKKMPSFFAVGAAHLPGNNGVINLLRKQGYKLTPVKF